MSVVPSIKVVAGGCIALFTLASVALWPRLAEGQTLPTDMQTLKGYPGIISVNPQGSGVFVTYRRSLLDTFTVKNIADATCAALNKRAVAVLEPVQENNASETVEMLCF